MIGLRSAASRTNQLPTMIKTYPLDRFTVEPVERTVRSTSAFRNDTATELETSSVTNTTAAAANPTAACVVPTVRD